MRHNKPVFPLAAALALTLALVSGILFFADSPVYAAEPEFVFGAGTRSVDENTPPGVNIGDPISATDVDEIGDNSNDALEFGNTLTYSLGGTDAAYFDIDASTGQLITKAPLNAEVLNSPLSVTVTVDDGETRDPPITQDVLITVTDVDEEPAAPFPPTVVSGKDDDTSDTTEQSTTSLHVVWHPPENTGPAITDYDVEYKKSTETTFFDDDSPNNPDTTATEAIAISGTTASITGLEADTSYQVRIRASNGEGDPGPWSYVGTGSTNKEGNSPPQSSETLPATRNVAENTPSGENVGNPVTATDKDTTTLYYRLNGPDAGFFNFDTRSAQIRTKASLNHEDQRCGYVEPDSPSGTTTCTYRVTVIVDDRAGGSDATGVNIVVTDTIEAPSTPARPTVRAKEKSSTSIVVTWSAPANPGPAITGYDVEYRKGSEPFSDDNCRDATADDNCQGITGTSTTITMLDDDTTYEVRIKAKNRERDSAPSATGTGRTNRDNHEPIFDDRPGTGIGSARKSDDGFTVWRTIDENPRAGHVVGRVFADDEDNDSLTYKLVASEVSDAARAEMNKFTINKTTGEIRTKEGSSYNYEAFETTGTCNPLTVQEVGSDNCYTVKVEVRDGLNTDRVEEMVETVADDSITVKIGIRDTDEPPEVPVVMVTSPARDTTNDITKLIVIWHADNTGPEITAYDVQYRKAGDSFLNDNCRDTDEDENCSILVNELTDPNKPSTTITGLEEDSSYSVQVRAKNDEGTSAWSRVETVRTNKGDNLPPAFNDQDAVTLSVAENTLSGRSVVPAVDATDTVTGSPTYHLGGLDASLFTIVRTSGQIQTRAALNHEDQGCDYDDSISPTVCSYSVLVKVDDGAGASASKEVTISVTDEDEPPSAPGSLRVTATTDTGWSLEVTWNAPSNTGKPAITDYDVQYRKYKATDPDEYELWPHGSDTDAADNTNDTDTSTRITRRAPGADADPLEPSTQYEVRVRAKNGEGDQTENWSDPARGTTGPSNSRPAFDREGAIELRVDENTAARQNIGSAISASDADSNNLSYTLEGTGTGSFTIVRTSGQIQTMSPLNYEVRQSYSLTVKVDDGQRRMNSIAAKSVTITVDNVREAPSKPAIPAVAGISGSTSSVRVTWAAPQNTGPEVTGYDVQYREVGSGPRRWQHYGADRSTIITGLDAGTRYEVQVRARSDEGTGEWSRWGSGSPNPDVANRNPVFTAGSRTLSVPENTPPNTDVGDPIAATDRDDDTLDYTLEGADAGSFDILSTSDGGQIRTSASLNHEEKSSYSVTVRVRDGRGGADAVNVTISVTDVDGEAPSVPFAPTVTPVSSTRLQVTWDEPANHGPPITDYDYRYREPSDVWTEETDTTITETTVEITGLAASTSYDVEVRATNAEGTSDWSDPGIGSTNAPGANNLPVFADGTSTTRSVSADAQAGTNIGAPVRATDADSGDTVSYRLEGRDAANFDIVATSGQLQTKSGITLIASEEYTVIVVADDGTDTDRITVTIATTAAPPNSPPAFPASETGARSVPEGTAAGTDIGAPVAADDPGDTLTYTLGGTDAADFDIVAATGQLQTSSALDAATKSTYTVTVTATDTAGATDTITVTITVTTTSNLGELGDRYDANNNGVIERDEVITAIRHYFDDLISRDDVIAIIRLYFTT